MKHPRTTSTGLRFDFSSMSWFQQQQQMKSRGGWGAPWYQLVLVSIMPRLCCSESGSRLQSQCLWLHLTGTYCIKRLPAEDSQPPTKILASLLAGLVILYWCPCFFLGEIQQRKLETFLMHWYILGRQPFQFASLYDSLVMTSMKTSKQ